MYGISNLLNLRAEKNINMDGQDRQDEEEMMRKNNDE